MDKILSIQTIKNVFAALGAKTSDSNYAVGLFDKTSAEPKGIMGMSDLASVLGAIKCGGRRSADFDLNTVKETIALGGTAGAINKPSSASEYFIFVSIVSGTGDTTESYNSIQLYYDLLNGNFYFRAVRGGFAIFDDWYKYSGTAVV